MYGVVVEPEFGISRDGLLRGLKENGVETRTMFCPLNIQPSLVAREAVRLIPCPVAENLWENGFYLPSGNLTGQEIDTVCNAISQVAECA